MTAGRRTVRLYWRSTLELQQDRNIDPHNDGALRTVLEEMVLAKRGTLRLDLSEFRIQVHSLGGGRILARCEVDSGGLTKVIR
jgi:hypothetical protein